MKNYVRQIVQWMAAGLLAVLLCNVLLCLYHRPAGWIERTKSATNAIWRPGSTLIMGTEGRGVYHVDQDGYLNADLPRQEGYCLVLGASYTQGKEVRFGERYTDLLNAMLAESDDKLAVYNCSQDAKFLPGIINDFYAITQEFADAGTIVIETGNTDFTAKELATACEQHGYDENQRGSVLAKTMTPVQQLKLRIKEGAPLYTILKSQLAAMKGVDATARNEEDVPVADSAQEESLHTAFSLIRSQYDGALVILYHPTVSLTESGELEVDVQETTPMFRAACEANNILFVDVSEAFLAAYEAEYAVPYGFSNTTMCTGHLSADGHRVIAEELYKVLKEVQ